MGTLRRDLLYYFLLISPSINVTVEFIVPVAE